MKSYIVLLGTLHNEVAINVWPLRYIPPVRVHGYRVEERFCWAVQSRLYSPVVCFQELESLKISFLNGRGMSIFFLCHVFAPKQKILDETLTISQTIQLIIRFMKEKVGSQLANCMQVVPCNKNVQVIMYSYSYIQLLL